MHPIRFSGINPSILLRDGDVRRRWAGYVLLILIGGLLWANYLHGLSLGQDQTMYAPVYRWRQTLLAALSALTEPPSKGYLIHGSLLRYFIDHGMAILGSDYSGPPPATPEWLALMRDAPRLDALILGALGAPVDPSAAPDILRGAEVGFVDYMILSFRLFGARIESLYHFYFLVLALSCLSYVVAFRRSPVMLYLLTAFLSAHYAYLDYLPQAIELLTVHNSRLFSAPALLPAGHLLLALLYQPFPRYRHVIPAAVQSAILVLLLRCRTDVAWVVAIPLAVALLVTIWSPSWRLLLSGDWIRARVSRAWPALLLAATLAIGSGMSAATIDHRYKTEAATGHPLWHAIYTGLVDRHPVLYEKFNYGAPRHSDEIGYFAVLEDLRRRHDTAHDIVIVQNGKIYIDIMTNVGEYDQLLKPLTLKLIRDHPWECLATVGYKIEDQIAHFAGKKALDLSSYTAPLLICLIAALLTVSGLRSPLRRQELAKAAGVLAVVLPFSLATPMVDATLAAVGTLLVYVMLFLVTATYLPSAWLANWLRRKYAS